MGSYQVVVFVSFIKPDLFDNNVPFVNTTPIYLINLLWKLTCNRYRRKENYKDMDTGFIEIFDT